MHRLFDTIHIVVKSLIVRRSNFALLATAPLWALAGEVASVRMFDAIPNKLCEESTTACLTERAERFGQFRAEKDGPNCFNLSLVFTGILPAARFTSSEEMQFYTESPLCHARAPGEKPQPGDIGTLDRFIRSGQEPLHWEPNHAFIVISENTVYEKTGQSRNDAYHFLSKKKSFEPYYLDAKTEMSSKAPDYVWWNRRAKYYHCESLNRYLSKNTVPSDLRRFLGRLDDIERKYEGFLISGHSLPTSELQGLPHIAAELKAYASENKEMSASSRWLVKAIRLRLLSLADQMLPSKTDRDHTEMAPALDQLSDRLRKAAEAIDP